MTGDCYERRSSVIPAEARRAESRDLAQDSHRPSRRQGLYGIARRMEGYENHRAELVTLYLTMVDEDGTEVRIDRKGERTLYPYRSAADEHDL